MTVVDDLLAQLRGGETTGAAGEVVSRRPREASCDGGGANGSTPEALEAPGTVAGSSDAVKCPVLFTQVARCDDCPWACCETDGTCWKAELDERERLKGAGELRTAPVAYAAPWSKRARHDEAIRQVREEQEAEERREAKEAELKAERAAANGGRRGWGTRPIVGGNSPRFVTPKPTPTEELAEATVKPKKVNRGSQGNKIGRPWKITIEQFDVAFEQLEQGQTARGLAHAHWQEWGYASPEAAYMGLRRRVIQSGRGWPGKQTAKEAA